jgi:hypothetical protein
MLSDVRQSFTEEDALARWTGRLKSESAILPG